MANFVYDLSCAIMLFLVYLNGQKNEFNKTQRVFSCFVLSVQIFLLLDGVSWLCEIKYTPLTVVLEIIFMSFLFFFQGFQGLFWILYGVYYLEVKHQASKLLVIIGIVQTICSGIIVILNIFTGLLFTVNMEEGYIRGPLYLINYILYGIYFIIAIIMDLYVYFSNKDADKKRAAIINFVGVMIVLFCFVIQFLYIGVNLVSPALSITILMIYLSVQAKKMEEVKIDHIRNLEAKTFCNFDLLYKGQSIKFKRSKSKELLAYLIDKKGSSVSLDELYVVLWEKDVVDDSTKSFLRNIISDIKKTLNELGIDGFFIKDFNSCRINPEFVSCDYYDYLDGNSNICYTGEYMNQYSWAESTAGYLERTMNKK